MNKKILTLGILFVVLAGVFAPVYTNAQLTPEEACRAIDGRWNGTECVNSMTNGTGFSVIGWIAAQFFKAIGEFLMLISSIILITAGMLFDWVIGFTIVDMAKNIGDPNGVGGSITNAWATLRDIANMCFIFVLLFAAFKAMFSLNFSGIGTTIRNIIIVALLINFSLFFSKVVIDASNIVSVGFYNSIATANNQTTLQGNQALGSTANFKGISGGYMRMLGLQTWYGAEILDSVANDPLKILVLGVMTSVFMLVAAIIFLIAGIMFAARFIILILLMILSPLALIAYIIPGMQGKFNEWKDALINQSFFAPLYFALTWVVFKLGSSFIPVLKAAQGTNAATWTNVVTDPKSAMSLIVNYVLIIGFSIAALVFSKQMASKGATAAAFKGITGAIGTGVIGGAALLGRQTVGRGSKWVSENARESWSKSSVGRAGLWLANKGSKGSFDARSIDTIGKVPVLGKEMDILGKAGGKGGFGAAVDAKAKAKAQYAKDVYGQTPREKEEAERLENVYKDKNQNAEIIIKAEEEKIKAERRAEREETGQIKTAAEKDVAEREKILAAQTNARDYEKANKALEESKLRSQKATEAHNQAIGRERAKIENTDYSKATQALKTEAEQRKQEWERVKNQGKERQESYAARVKTGGPVSMSAGGVIGGAIGGFAGPVGALVGAGIGAGVGRWVGGKININWRGNEESARKIVEEARGKAKKDKSQLKKDLAKMGLIDDEEGEGGEEKKEEKKEESSGTETKTT